MNHIENSQKQTKKLFQAYLLESDLIESMEEPRDSISIFVIASTSKIEIIEQVIDSLNSRNHQALIN